MRLRRIAAGSRGWLGVEGGRAKELEALVCRCSQACLAASMRVRWASVSARLGVSANGTRSAQVAYLAGLRTGGGGLFHVARGLRPSASAKRAGPNRHVYPKGARPASRWIFAGCGAAGHGILKDQAK